MKLLCRNINILFLVIQRSLRGTGTNRACSVPTSTALNMFGQHQFRAGRFQTPNITTEHLKATVNMPVQEFCYGIDRDRCHREIARNAVIEILFNKI